MNFKLFVTLILVALSAIFIVQNADVVDLRFLFWTTSMSRSLMFVFLILIGIIIGWLLRVQMSRKRKSEKIKNMR